MVAPPPPGQSAAASASASSPAAGNQSHPTELSQTPEASLITAEIPAPEPSESVPATASTAPDALPAASYTITIPSCSSWFSWDGIHETERRILPEFFDGKSASRNPSVYKYYRDYIIGRFRANPSRKITFTESRRGLVGDVGSVRRVFDFLEAWGLINYTPSARPLAKEKKDSGETVETKDAPKRICSNCKSLCGTTFFNSEKADMTICSRCFVCGSFRAGLNASDFKRVDVSEETKTEWTDKETLHLLEAILYHGEDWKKVAEYVGSRSERECVARFIKLPFGEQFLGPPEYKENDEVHSGNSNNDIVEPSSKRKHLTPLADASNPVMAQVAFLAAMAGPAVAEAATDAAIAAFDDVDPSIISNSIDERIGLGNQESGEEGTLAENDQTFHEMYKEAAAEAQSQLDKEQQEVEQSISDIVEVQMKEIQDKLVRFEKVEMLLEKEWRQLKHMKDFLFADQLTVLQHKPRLKPPETGNGEKVRTSNSFA
ncbi:SWI/SNF complex subunit SWI3B [Apostasia shenzhenica]|uniref:SWI/SNF complex subunit SWI3B n=1 Tax=Apostasia shenzhenica TaxID=1088818 RepID=A0A2I0AJS8_9ASPA|nr:SWI/SNF complex subunit SWI3B [Apostasia shenzhenica]